MNGLLCTYNLLVHPYKYGLARNIKIEILGQELTLSLSGWKSRLIFASLAPEELIYEVSALRTIHRLFKSNPTNFVDVGVHVGYFTCLIAARFPDVQCIGFEIEPSLCIAAEKNAILNHAPNVTIINSAVADRPGELKYELPRRIWHHPILVRRNKKVSPSRLLKISAVSLDDYSPLFGPGHSIIKIDVEGAELTALKGMSRLLKEKSPMLVIELHRNELAKAGHSPSELFELLHTYDYSLHEITNFRSPDEEPEFKRVIEGYVPRFSNSMIVGVKRPDEHLLWD